MNRERSAGQAKSRAAARPDQSSITVPGWRRFSPARFDIVGFDPRGVGGSEPAVRCLTGPQLNAYFATNENPTTAILLALVTAGARKFARGCERESGGRGADHVGQPALRLLAGPPSPLPSIRAAGAPPILVVGNERDPATAYRWAQALAPSAPGRGTVGPDTAGRVPGHGQTRPHQGHQPHGGAPSGAGAAPRRRSWRRHALVGRPVDSVGRRSAACRLSSVGQSDALVMRRSSVRFR